MIEAGQVFTFDYPFIREAFEEFDPEGKGNGAILTSLRWRPGVRFEDRMDACDAVADGIGQQILTIVSTHKPGTYGLRVFYTRQWVDPDGVEFGNRQLRIKGIAAFTSLIRGYAYEFKLAAKADAA